MKTRKCFMLTLFMLTTMTMMAQVDAPGNLTSYRGKNGDSYTFKVTGSTTGRIWGGDNNIYTDDSNFATAVVHAGVVGVGETAVVRVTILAGRDSYPSITRNGITSIKYGSWSGSYQINGKVSVNSNDNILLAPNDGKLTSYRGKSGEYTFQVTGRTKGRIWGGNENIYTDDSDIATAAVHAGVLNDGQTGNVKVKFIGGMNSYPSITRNGVTSISYGSYQGSYQILNGSTVTVSNNEQLAPANMTEYRGKNGTVYTFKVTGKTDGRIWGGNDNVYTDDSNIATAAVHAGLVRAGETAVIKVTVMKGLNNYPSLSRNGITSIKYGSWSGSYKLSK